MKIIILSIGKLKGYWSELESQYLKQLTPYYQIEQIILKDSKEKSREKIRNQESDEIIKRIEKYKDYTTILLDETGKSYTSLALSTWVEKEKITGKLLFIIGGPWGVNDDLRKEVNHSIKLSDLTLTHEMAKVLLLEQLFRVCKIQQGGDYHK